MNKQRWGVMLILSSVCPLAAAPAVAEPVRTPQVQRMVTDGSDGTVGTASAITAPGVRAVARPLPAGATVVPLNPGNVAGEAPGTAVYKNEVDPVTNFFAPGANNTIMDDLQLASGACEVIYYNLVVFGPTSAGSSYNVQTALWNGDPCAPGSSIIPGTEVDFNGVPTSNTDLYQLDIDLGTPIPVPGTVWLAATFSIDGVGWVVAGQAEIGSTENFFSDNQSTNVCITNAECATGFTCTDSRCQLCSSGTTLQQSFAGFYASLHCDLDTTPTGACCNNGACTITEEAACAGNWRGAFTACTPDPCGPGTCCSGTEFNTCTNATESTCPNGLFRPGETCAADGCPGVHRVFVNNFNTGSFAGIGNTLKWADDIFLGPEGPCELAAYDMLVTGDPSGGATFNARVELWTNIAGDPNDPFDDKPGVMIPGTGRDFTGIPANFFGQRLLVRPPQGIILPARFWIVLSTSTGVSGPLLGGNAKIGFSDDAFAVFNHGDLPDDWLHGFFFSPGFNPVGCPTELSCNPAGSFRTSVMCVGDRPTGACCEDAAESCDNDARSFECEGRWKNELVCEADPFTPTCGEAPCCVVNPLNPVSSVCIETAVSTCTDPLGFNGTPVFGTICDTFTCPPVDCLGRAGSCFASHGTSGCDDAFCCQKVCIADPFCCQSAWDSTCVNEANNRCTPPVTNDDRTSPMPLAGVGTFTFDNTKATTDGPTHAGCNTLGDLDLITNDVWYCWTASCSQTVFVETCGLTDLDTRVAVYAGCGATPSDANLITCNDDGCGTQSVASFQAVSGQQYLIRVGNAPYAKGGPGAFRIRCGAPSNPACPGSGSCCDDTGTPGCTNADCCNTVCACDSWCCNVEWDIFCATNGENNSGCGAEALCQDLCGDVSACPAGNLTWLDPPDMVVDARYPKNPGTGAPLGITTIQVSGPPGAEPSCWSLCETGSTGFANGILSVVENAGTYTITLERPITPLACTTIGYTNDDGVTLRGRFRSHPGNTNGDTTASPADILAVIDCINGINPALNCPYGLYSGDADRSGIIGPADILAVIDMLNGSAALDVAVNTTRPSCAACE